MLKVQTFRRFALFVFIIIVGGCDKNELIDQITIKNSLILNDTVFCSFYYKNRTDELMTVNKLKYDCGCVNGSIDKSRIERDSSSRINFSFLLNEYKKVIHKRLNINYNDDKNHTFILNIYPHYILQFYPKSRKLYFTNDTIRNKVIKIYNLSKEEIKIENIDFTNEMFHVNELKIKNILPKDSLLINVSYDSSDKKFNSSLMSLKTDLETYPLITFKLYAINS